MITITVENDECLPKEAAQEMANAIHLFLKLNDVGKVVQCHSDSKPKFGDDSYFDLEKQKVQIKVVKHNTNRQRIQTLPDIAARTSLPEAPQEQALEDESRHYRT